MENPNNNNNNNNNNNKLQILAPMPLTVCLPNSESSSTQNVASSSSSVTPLRNHRMYNPRLNRLTAVKRLARNRRKTYPKYGPYPCQWCSHVLPTSQAFAGHMRAHYRAVEKDLKAVKQQAQGQQHLTPQQQQVKAKMDARARARAELARAKAKTQQLAILLAHAKAKVRAATQSQTQPSILPKPQARAAAARAPAPATVPAARALAPEPAPAPVVASSGSGQCPLRINDCHLRIVNSSFGIMCSAGDKNNSMSTSSISNAIDFLYSKRIERILQNSPPADLHHHQVVPPGFASCSRSRAPKDINKKLVVVKQEVFPDEDVKPPPGFHHLLTTGHDGRRFIIKEEKVEYDDDVVACGSFDR